MDHLTHDELLAMAARNAARCREVIEAAAASGPQLPLTAVVRDGTLQCAALAPPSEPPAPRLSKDFDGLLRALGLAIRDVRRPLDQRIARLEAEVAELKAKI